VSFNSEIWRSEEGSALSSVLIISVIILTFIGAIFAGILLQARFIQKDINKTKAIYAAEEQLFKYLSNPELHHSSIQKKFQNGFERVQSTASVGNATVAIQALVGETSIVPFQLSTVVLDSRNTLTLTGNTTLKGDYAISNNAITTSSFRGIPFRGILEGAPSEDTVSVNLDYSKYQQKYEGYEALFEEANLNRFEVRNINSIQAELAQNDTLYISESIELELGVEVLSESITFIVDGNLSLSGSMNLPDFSEIIVSDSVSISGELKGNFIQIYAGNYLSISDDVQLSAQVFSGGSIEVNDQAYLTYPSVLYSQKDTYAGGSRSAISLNDQAIIDGTILYPFEPSLINQEQLKVTVDTTALVRGAIYNSGLTELFGTIHGTVITDQFYFYESPTSYFNWIKDATIDLTQRPPDFVTPIGFSDSVRYKILDWRIIE